MPRRTLLLVLLVLFRGTEARAAPAEKPPAASEAARKHFTAGESLFREGRFAEAIAAFEEGYRLVPRPLFLINIGHAQRRMGDLRRARASYRKFLIVDPASPRRGEVEAVIQELDAAIVEEDGLGPGGKSEPRERHATAPTEQSVETPPLPTAPPAAVDLVAPAPSSPPSASGRIWKTWWFWTAAGALALGTAAVFATQVGGSSGSVDGTIGTLRR